MHDARPTVADLRDLIRRPGPNNDLIELTAKQPRLAELTASVFPRAIRRSTAPTRSSRTRRPYIPDLSGWLTKFGQVAAYYDANGHYARVQPVFGPTRLDRDLQAHRRPRLGPPEPVRAGTAGPTCPGGPRSRARRIGPMGRERL